MSFMSRMLSLIRPPQRSWVNGLHLHVQLRRNERLLRLTGASVTRPWFSAVEEKQFSSKQLERRTPAESVARLSVAR